MGESSLESKGPRLRTTAHFAYNHPVTETPGRLSTPRGDEGDVPQSPPWADWVSLGCGVASVGWLVIGLLPRQLPAWPSASLGLLALVLAWPRGRAMPRAVGAFLGLAGLVGAGAQIIALWGLSTVVGS